MSAAAAAPVEGAAPAPVKGKKKLIVIAAAVLLLAMIGGGAAVFVMKKKAAEAAAAVDAEGEDAPASAHDKGGKHEALVVPTFLPLEPFVVNLADRDVDRYAQIGITLEVVDAKFAEQMKAYLPAIRNGILMTLAHKTSAELLERKGKEQLAREIMRESVRPMGIEVDEAEPAEAEPEAKPGDDAAKKKAKKKKAPTVENPVKRVHFSNFIIQ
jgi:flagellar FliL protein